ncbi:MAG: arginine deiminase-related protein [Bacteroidia bacterium]
MKDVADLVRPDAIFLNNWISTHEDGTVILYPMMAPNRRSERRQDAGRPREIPRNPPCGRSEPPRDEWLILEGTGSMILDRANGVIYACCSSRTNEAVLKEVAKTLDYRCVVFDFGRKWQAHLTIPT